MTKLDELKAKQVELRQQIRTESEAWLKEEARAMFDRHPEWESFSWQQYTPHFNDGDECVFSAHIDHDSVKINGVGEWDGDDYKEESTKAKYKEVAAFLRQIDEPTYKEMFGDHCQVTVRRNGITVEEYSHD